LTDAPLPTIIEGFQDTMSEHADNTLVFYSLEQDAESQWESIREACPHFHPSTRVIKLLRSGLDEFVGSVAIERAYVCKDHRDLHSHFLSKKFRDRSSHCSRLHFFSDAEIDAYTLIEDPQRAQDAYLGYSVIRPVPMSEIGRTVLDAAKLGFTHEDDYFLMKTRFRASLNGVDLYVEGFPFMTQDSEATVCSHAALWGICRYLSQRYSEYGEFLPYDLISRTSSDGGRALPYRGMTHTDYARILDDFGCHPVSFAVKVGEESFLDACTYVESGIPLIASLSPDKAQYGHVVNLIGHTMNPEACVHRTGFCRELEAGNESRTVVDSAAFLDSFLVVDDNLFPYRQLGFKEFGKSDERIAPRGYSIERFRTVVAPLPEKVYMSASVARKMAYSILKEMLVTSRVREHLEGPEKDPLVARLFFTSCRAFKSRKLTWFREFENDLLLAYPLTKHLPHFVWVMEISRKSDYFRPEIERRCIGEIVLDATSNEFEKSLIYARVADLVNSPDPGATDSKSFWQSSEKCACHFPPFFHNLGHRDPLILQTTHLPDGRNA